MLFIVFSLVTLTAFCIHHVQCETPSLNVDSFMGHLGQHKTMAVAFVAPWCNKCKEFLPKWEEMAVSMQNEQDEDIFLAKVDCVAEPDVYYKEGIEYFPTIKTYVNYNAMSIEYDGERKTNTMWRYLRLMHEQYVNEIFSVDEFINVQGLKLKANRPLVVAVLPSDEELTDSNDMFRKVDAACKMADQVRCYFARNPEFVNRLGLSVNSLTLYSSFNGDEVDDSIRLKDANLVSASDMSIWIMMNAYPATVELTHLNDNLIFSERRPGFQNHFLFLLNDANSEEGTAILAALKEASADSIGKCVFIYVNLATLSDNMYAAGILESLQADQSVSKAFAVMSKKPSVRFYSGLEGQLQSAAAIKVWVNDVLSGTVQSDREIQM